jgi:MoaA/NifB/PqqE/SkfB family radical SAM enzyme/SAM-dependent methyltransferase
LNERTKSRYIYGLVKALIKVGYGCNNHCSFCHTLDVRHIDDTTLGVHQKIQRAANLGYSMVVLSGGEPTMRPELTRWASHSAALGMDFGLVTNGRMLAYPQLVDRLEKFRLQYVYMSLHGGTAKVHNAMVRAHAFEDTFGAVKELSGRGLDLTVNCVITSVNVDHLIELVDRVLPFDDVVLKFSMVEPKGAADKLFDAVIPRISDVAAKVVEAIHYGQERSTGLAFAHDGIPLCLLPGLEHLYDDLKTHGFASMTEVYEPDFYPVDNANCVQTERCTGCGLSGPCVGLYKGYNAEFGDGELEPVDGLRSNSFNYVYEREISWERGTPCPVHESGVTPYDRGRHVFVRVNGHMRQHRTFTRDFSDAAIARIKREQGQMYLDTSDKDAPDDFSADLKKLSLLSECQSCELVSKCAGCYEVSDEEVFGRDDEQVATLLKDLRGDVLDVGCGESRYGPLLEALVQSGQIRYTGVEPDGALAEAFRAKHPWAEVMQSAIEDMSLEDERYDHIILLRSYNHVRDAEVVFRRLTRAIRPGGSLLVVDNVAFGLVRSVAQARRAESSYAAFEHYHNHSAAEASERIANEELTLRRLTDVSPSMSNQWVLVYEKTPRTSKAVSTL